MESWAWDEIGWFIAHLLPVRFMSITLIYILAADYVNYYDELATVPWLNYPTLVAELNEYLSNYLCNKHTYDMLHRSGHHIIAASSKNSNLKSFAKSPQPLPRVTK